MMTEHRWSGWPGAWCLDCGSPDLVEECLAGCAEGDPTEGIPCADHRNNDCPEPGSKRHDPYARKEGV